MRDYAFLPGNDNVQCRWLAKTIDWSGLSGGLWPRELVPGLPIHFDKAKERLTAMSFVGNFDRYGASVERFARAFGLKELPSVRENYSRPRKRLSDREEAMTRMALYANSRVDTELLRFARDLPAYMGTGDPSARLAGCADRTSLVA